MPKDESSLIKQSLIKCKNENIINIKATPIQRYCNMFMILECGISHRCRNQMHHASGKSSTHQK
jgi:hypothetical protein